MTHAITSEDDLRARFRQPSQRAATKVVDRIDEAKARFIALSPLVLLATSGADGRCDLSPRGGPPGFVTVLDERHVALPDLGGNNRLDSYGNIVANGHAGLLFVVPTRDETVRVNGPAVLSTDPAVLDRCHPGLRRPSLALVVETEEVFGHCTKAFRRAGVWHPDTWAAYALAPDYAEMYAGQTPGLDADGFRAELGARTDEQLAQEGVTNPAER
jgi:PPOX class probable FMN-dependent enzyme